MSDKLGIVGCYRQHEVTHASIHLAEFAQDRGTRASLYGTGHVRREVALQWDDQVITTKQQPLIKWAATCNRVIFTQVPPQQVVRRIQAMGVDTAILLNWETLFPKDHTTVAAFDKVISPYRCVAKAVERHWELPGVTPILLPWDVSVPISRRDNSKPHGELCVYVPMHDSQPQRLDQAVFKLMRKVLAETNDTNIVVSCGRKWSLSSKRIIKALRKDFGDRIVLVLHPNILQRLLLFGRADLTVWAPRFESFGLIGLTSLCMGAPVISWDMQPQNEYLTGWKNSVLVPAKTEENWFGVPEVKSGYGAFGEMLIATLQDKALISKLKKHVSHDLDNRRRQFEAGWDTLCR